MPHSAPPFIPYPPIGRLGVVGDRRSAAMIAADGTLAWWCLPNFDGEPVFGALLDAHAGGYFRLGPRALLLGAQSYLPESAVLVTRWETAEACLELTDAMLWPQTERAAALEHRRTVLRRLRCTEGAAACRLELAPRPDFTATTPNADGLYRLGSGAAALGLWCSRPAERCGEAVCAEFALRAGDEVWAVAGAGEVASRWSVERAREALAETLGYWRRWSAQLCATGSRAARIKQSALLVHLLSFAPTGAPIAAPTASLPERIGGGRNYDYRFSWLRDASLSLSLLSELGFTGDETRYLDWLAQLPPGDNMPFQTVYRADSGTAAPVRERRDLAGYRGSQPVRFGNAAFKMKEIGSFGYLADCIWTYVERDGPWQDAYWRVVHRIADFSAGHWQDRDCGIWEIAPRAFVTSRVLSWTVLDRAIKIAERVGRRDAPTVAWRQAMAAIREAVLTCGWSDKMHAFRQHEEADTVDAALLLMPLLGFLPLDDPRVEATVAQIEARLMIDGFVHRYVEEKFPGNGSHPLGEEEGSFAMCTSWLAHYYARRGEGAKAEAILSRLEATAPAGLLAEATDSRSGAQLGNAPLLFSQVEYAKAAMALADAERRGA